MRFDDDEFGDGEDPVYYVKRFNQPDLMETISDVPPITKRVGRSFVALAENKYFKSWSDYDVECAFLDRRFKDNLEVCVV